MVPLLISNSSSDERREWIRRQFPCIANCEQCGLCAVYHNRDVEEVYADYIKGLKTFEEIAREYRCLK